MVKKVSNRELRREKMLEKIAMDVNGTTEVKVGDNIINFKAPFRRVPMLEAIKEFTGYDLNARARRRYSPSAKN